MALNSEITYRLTRIRFAGFFTYPAFIALIIAFIVISAPSPKTPWEWVCSMLIYGVFLFWLLSYLLIFFNHYPYAASMKIRIGGKKIAIMKGETTHTYLFHEITAIKKYSPKFARQWGGICFWSVEVSDTIHIISNLSISEPSFNRYFYNKIEAIDLVFPFLPNPIE